MCSCWIAAARAAAITPLPARQASAGHTRRWTKVTLLSTSLKQRTSSASSSSDSAAKIALPLGCAHQLPTIGWPATASATLGTGPRAEARTTPCCSTKDSHRLPAGGELRRALPVFLAAPRPADRRPVEATSLRLERARLPDSIDV